MHRLSDYVCKFRRELIIHLATDPIHKQRPVLASLPRKEAERRSSPSYGRHFQNKRGSHKLPVARCCCSSSRPLSGAGGTDRMIAALGASSICPVWGRHLRSYRMKLSSFPQKGAIGVVVLGGAEEVET